jgi:2-methylfumaryl-CoA hydratase
MNLTLCMAVEPYSESCLLHLGLEDVVYENPAYSGDTFRCYIFIEGLRNTSNRKTSVISSKHVLVNQNGQRVFSFRRKTLFPYVENLEKKQETADESLNDDLQSLLRLLIEGQVNERIKVKTEILINPNRVIEANDLLLHDASRMISESENLTFSTLFRNTHPIHFNYLRYAANEIVVCGGFVMAVVLANALKDLKQAVDQKIISCSHINKIRPNDTISSVSYVHDSFIENGFEVLTLKTIGLRNVDAAVKLRDRQWPKSLFSKEDFRPAEMERLIKDEIPELFHKVCIQIHWKVWRPIS